jgi:bifunctional non-homologous end joining protein LigD
LADFLTGPEFRSLPTTAPGFVEPMKALLRQELPRGSQWLYELKFDGIRALAIKKATELALISRAGNNLNSRYPGLVKELRQLPEKQALLDGEIVALDAQGRPSFQVLQSYHANPRKPPLLYYAFDILNLEGKDLRSLPLWRRKEILQEIARGFGPGVRLAADIVASNSRLLAEMQARGLEGLIAKEKNSKYESGRRSGAWVKFKWSQEQEFVIGGYTPPKGARAYFGAILVGYFEQERLIFAAKVGTGFDHRTLQELYARFQKLLQGECPFANLPEDSLGPGRGITRSEMRQCSWLEPRLVCQVRFSEWTRDGHLRQPAFLGLREDKRAREVVRERAQV